jgi:hypothetical protein
MYVQSVLKRVKETRLIKKEDLPAVISCIEQLKRWKLSINAAVRFIKLTEEAGCQLGESQALYRMRQILQAYNIPNLEKFNDDYIRQKAAEKSQENRAKQSG